MDSEGFEDAVSKHEQSSVYEEPMKIDDETNITPNNKDSDNIESPSKVKAAQNRTNFEGAPERQTCCAEPIKCIIF